MNQFFTQQIRSFFHEMENLKKLAEIEQSCENENKKQDVFLMKLSSPPVYFLLKEDEAEAKVMIFWQ